MKLGKVINIDAVGWVVQVLCNYWAGGQEHVVLK